MVRASYLCSPLDWEDTPPLTFACSTNVVIKTVASLVPLQATRNTPQPLLGGARGGGGGGLLLTLMPSPFPWQPAGSVFLRRLRKRPPKQRRSQLSQMRGQAGTALLPPLTAFPSPPLPLLPRPLFSSGKNSSWRRCRSSSAARFKSDDCCSSDRLALRGRCSLMVIPRTPIPLFFLAIEQRSSHFFCCCTIQSNVILCSVVQYFVRYCIVLCFSVTSSTRVSPRHTRCRAMSALTSLFFLIHVDVFLLYLFRDKEKRVWADLRLQKQQHDESHLTNCCKKGPAVYGRSGSFRTYFS